MENRDSWSYPASRFFLSSGRLRGRDHLKPVLQVVVQANRSYSGSRMYSCSRGGAEVRLQDCRLLKSSSADRLLRIRRRGGPAEPRIDRISPGPRVRDESIAPKKTENTHPASTLHLGEKSPCFFKLRIGEHDKLNCSHIIFFEVLRKPINASTSRRL